MNGPGDRINVLLGTLVNAKCCAVNEINGVPTPESLSGF